MLVFEEGELLGSGDIVKGAFAKREYWNSHSFLSFSLFLSYHENFPHVLCCHSLKAVRPSDHTLKRLKP
jgi:hypothetical protein